MKIKTSLIIIAGCFVIFLFIMLPIFLSVNNEKEEYLSKYQGSSFSLKDVNNEIITEESFNGPLTAVFFGFTNCPDVCPMTLNNLDLVINNLENKKKNKFKVFFVSIDPERDSTQIINDYLNTFENKIYGITGDPKKVFLFSKSWGIISEKIFTEEGEYLINHSSSIILLRNGKFLSRISHHANYEKIFSTINKYL
ncbi:MAG: SCO family protein [Candidatus Pelagibacter sp.]|tara:strand:+ start:1239 stop:1826 length:588 start_codon:yes stop_codon:yes gene_type:complete